MSQSFIFKVGQPLKKWREKTLAQKQQKMLNQHVLDENLFVNLEEALKEEDFARAENIFLQSQTVRIKKHRQNQNAPHHHLEVSLLSVLLSCRCSTSALKWMLDHEANPNHLGDVCHVELGYKIDPPFQLFNKDLPPQFSVLSLSRDPHNKMDRKTYTSLVYVKSNNLLNLRMLMTYCEQETLNAKDCVGNSMLMYMLNSLNFVKSVDELKEYQKAIDLMLDLGVDTEMINHLGQTPEMILQEGLARRKEYAEHLEQIQAVSHKSKDNEQYFSLVEELEKYINQLLPQFQAQQLDQKMPQAETSYHSSPRL